MLITYTTPDHPLSKSDCSDKGEIGWTLSFPLDNGDGYLEVRMGEKARKAFIHMLKEEAIDFPDTKYKYYDEDNIDYMI